MEKVSVYIKSHFFKRIAVVVVIGVLLYLFKELLNTFLLTLIFILLAYRFVGFINRITKIPKFILIIVIYLLFIGMIYYLVNNFVVEISNQTDNIVQIMIKFYDEQMQEDSFLTHAFNFLFDKVDIKQNLQNIPTLILDSAKNIGGISLTIFMSFILSFFFLLDFNEVKAFNLKILDSRFSWLWEEVAYIGNKFIKTFGLVLETQFIISLINTTITLIGLSILGFTHLFPLAIIIFICGLVPVAGVFISMIPLCIVGYMIGGFKMVLMVVLLVIIIHAIEAYILNPKIMSSRTHLPIFVVFLVLFVGEKIMGPWGFILAIPLFVFLLDLLEIDINNTKPKKFNLKKIDKNKDNKEEVVQ